MRGNLVLLVVVLAAVGSTFGWRITRDARNRAGIAAISSPRLDVPRSTGLAITRPVRVNVTARPPASAEIAIDGPYVLRAAGAPEPAARGQRLDRTTVVPIAGGFRLGGRDFPGDYLDFEPEQSPSLWVDDRQYRGGLRLGRGADGLITCVNLVPLEDYVAGVVDGEMPASFPDAARQAQAIAARTYVVFQMQSARRSALFDVHSSVRSQHYVGYQHRDRAGRRYSDETDAGRRAAVQTRGIVCLYAGKPFCTYYTAVCGGRTSEGRDVFGEESAMLRSVDCPWCQNAELYRWTAELPLSEATSRLRAHFAAERSPLGDLASIRRLQAAAGAGGPAFEVNDGKRRRRISAQELRRLFASASIHSLEFDAHISGGRVVLDGRGHGHGVGMCQWGARGMAQAGYGPLEILRHYYPGAEIVAIE